VADRRLPAIAAAGTLLGAAVLFLLGAGPGRTRASDDRGPHGTAAFAAVLRRLDLPVDSLRVGLNPLRRAPAGSVLFLVSAPSLLPSAIVGEGELARLERWVEEGNTAVVVTHYPDAFLERLGPAFDWDSLPRLERDAVERTRPALAVLPGPLSLAGALAVEGRSTLAADGTDEALFAVDDHPVAVRRALGTGTVIAVSDPFTLENRGVGVGANLEFYLAVVRRHLGEGGHVLFDDLHAGGGDEFGVVAYARRAGLAPALLLLVLLAGAWLWRASARFGSLLPPADRRNPRASSELVFAIGGLYERAGLHAHALALMSRRFRRKVERRSGRSWKAEAPDAWVAAELGPEAARAFERIRHGFATLLPLTAPDADDVLVLARRIHRFETTWLDAPAGRSAEPPDLR
jgi:hypothetical protein